MSKNYSIDNAKEDWEPVEVLSGAVKFKSTRKIGDKHKIRFARGKNIEDAYTRLTPPRSDDINFVGKDRTNVSII